MAKVKNPRSKTNYIIKIAGYDPVANKIDRLDLFCNHITKKQMEQEAKEQKKDFLVQHDWAIVEVYERISGEDYSFD